MLPILAALRRGLFRRGGLSLTELMAVLGILGVLAALIVPRVVGHRDSSMQATCDAQQGDIELQVKLWRRNHGAYPAANLSDIGADAAYFPGGLPICPVDGTAYTINTTSGLVIGHTH
jgi:prepilin-type N-terminal cleavage/methylation domain-containing protein